MASADELAELAQTNRLLQAEFELAKSQKLYFIFDLPALDPLPGQRCHGGQAADPLPAQLGRPADGIAYTLIKRTARKEPVREQICHPRWQGGGKPAAPAPPPKPGEAPRAPEVQALEITDMPTEYTLQLDDGTLLTVRSTLAEHANSKKNSATTTTNIPGYYPPPYFHLATPAGERRIMKCS